MLRMRPLNESDVATIKRWPPYPGDMEQMDYALRETGWLGQFRTDPNALLYAVEDGPN